MGQLGNSAAWITLFHFSVNISKNVLRICDSCPETKRSMCSDRVFEIFESFGAVRRMIFLRVHLTFIALVF
jgi:hypothetical protein